MTVYSLGSGVTLGMGGGGGGGGGGEGVGREGGRGSDVTGR